MGEFPHGGSRSPDQPSRARTLGLRVLVGALLIPVVLAVNYVGGVVFAGCVALLALVVVREFYGMFLKGQSRPYARTGMLAVVVLCLAFDTGGMERGGLVLTLFVLGILVGHLVRSDRLDGMNAVGVTVLGTAYVGWLLGMMILLRNLDVETHGTWLEGSPDPGRSLVYLVLLLTWAYDSIAYLVGSLLGRHGLFGRLSPSKTLEGTLGGLAGSVAEAVVAGCTFATYLGSGHAVVLVLLIGVDAQTGDRIESMVKRSTGTKDTSRILPGL